MSGGMDPFVFCIRQKTGENVPKEETEGLCDEIIKHLNKEPKEDMKVGEFVDIVTNKYNDYIQRLKRSGLKKKGKAFFISKGAKKMNYDPNEPKGREWWVRHLGGEENAPFFIGDAVAFGQSNKCGPGEEDEGTQPYFEDLRECLMGDAFLEKLHSSRQAGMRKKKRKKQRTKKKKPPTKKKKDSRKRHSPKKKKDSRKKKRTKR
tara:strand:+ start:649 stop:1263 length:615 start_codon:yes stop_codon:yes gene_type:complete